eukprot:jgi/Chrzof1/2339/Cz11g11160.t1
MWMNVKRAFSKDSFTKQKLAEYGLGAFAAYGIISNLNAAVLMTIAWMTIVKQTGMTPLAAGQWPKFLGIYAGLWVGASFMRPIRLSLALAAAPVFNKFMDATQTRLGVNKAVAFSILLAMIAVSSVCLILGIIVVCGGFPSGLPWQGS